MDKVDIHADVTTGIKAAASLKKRTITGTIMVFDEDGQTSGGVLRFAPGSLVVPAEHKKIKLLMSHDMQQPVGFMTDLAVSHTSVVATFEIPETEEGDKALAAVKAGLFDGLSVGATVERFDPNFDSGTVARVIQASLYEVSLVSTPAFPNTRVTSVTAQKKDNTMPTEPTAAQEKVNTTAAADEATGAEKSPAPAKVTAAINGSAPQPAASSPMSITAAADRIIQGVLAGDPAAMITAALTDVIPAHDKGEGFLKRTYVGQLWSASEAARPTIDSFGAPKKLTGLKAYGWRWVAGKTPVVGKYGSDKKDIPSNALATEPAEGVTQDFAAGWDVARKYIDLGDTGFIESIFQLATDDYRRKTEEWFTEQVLAAATVKADITKVLPALQKLPIEFGKLNARISTIQMGQSAYEGFLNLKDNQVPWWLQRQGEVDLSNARGVASNISFMMNPKLAANDILAYDSRAASYYEEGSSPIRAQVLDLPRGGVDVGVFGYAGALIHDPRVIMKATTTGAV
ncbi:hypothetical protein E4U03_07820 [Rothia nasimurium]|uniref:Prohead serine protease domain-containing protein n=1 Tax=Rothia nasimurium TaxID=85336 RepID=A0A4Y9F3M3_9MICC|nr:HK97 family phage prohead protease [Rothia nasimurium]MBF0808515.1 HK97 family phage prohead protease [Rothia nasimurium]TFU21909.1 hypothetical protein E4U03_07820 [Rothia nasimurium]